MKKTSQKIPAIRGIENKHIRWTLYSRIILIIMLTVIPFLIYYIYFIHFKESGNLTLIILPALFYVLTIFFIYKPAFMKSKQHIDSITDEHIGNYTLDEVKELFNEISSQEDDKDKEKINFYIDYKIHNANAYNITFFNFIKNLNGITISEFYLHTLTREELKSILGHEKAHFRKYSTILTNSWYITNLFMRLFNMALILLIGIESTWLMILLYIIFSYILRIPLNIFLYNQQRIHEYLSDYYSAKKYGKLNSINALLKVGRISEMDFHILKKMLLSIRRDKKLSFDDFDTIHEIIKKELPIKVLNPWHVDRLINKIFKSEEINKLIKKYTEKENEQKKKLIDKYKSKLTEKDMNNNPLDWKLFDKHIRDWKIDEIEYPLLINALLEYPKKQLVDLWPDSEEMKGTVIHPTFRQRILFLHKNIEELN